VRAAESAALDRLLDAARAGRSGALVVHGEPGIGKTELLDRAVASATGFRVARAAGVESETEMAFAGLHQLCRQLLESLDRLVAPQRQALTTIFGLGNGGSTDPFVVGVAVLNLLAAAAEEEPLLCVVDGADRLDRASTQTLGFVARRLSAESVVLVFGLRSPSAELTGVPELRVDGLSDSAARALLESVTAGPLDERVRDRILAEARGNPGALLQLPKTLTPAELAGGMGLPAVPPADGARAESLRLRLDRLPAQTRLLSLLAAAEPVGEPALLRRAALRLGLYLETAAPPEADGLFTLGTGVAFRDPLVRSVAYHAAPARQRSAVHRALAETVNPALDPDRHTWHRAQAAHAPDDELADELERCADRARARGSLAAAAGFLGRAVVLAADPARRAERALAAARAMHDAGESEQAVDLLPLAQDGPLDEVQRAHLELLTAQIAFAPALLVRAAKRLEPIDARLARDTYLEAMYAAVFSGSVGSPEVIAVAEAARAASAPPAPRSVDLLLDGLAARLTEGQATGAPLLKRALAGFSAGDIRWHHLAFHAADELWDDDAAHALAHRMVRLARRRKELGRLPQALSCLAYRALCEGEFGAAAELLEEAESVAAATGGTALVCLRPLLAAWRGQEEEVVSPGGEGLFVTGTEYASAVLNNGLGRYDAALVAAQRALVREELFSPWILPELIEAATRTGDLELAGAAVERLGERARASGTELALAIESVGRALVSHGDAADGLYREGVEGLGHSRIAPYRARAHLLYGEWLRRERRRTEARAQLQAASELFAAMGAVAFADRAARELLAAGQPSVRAGGQLTLREAQVAELARDGHSNKEIASRLFISASTVEYHLHKVYTKLGIVSRNQLYRVLAGGRDLSRPRTVAPPSAALAQQWTR
jgi:DNA-binding CsgD family transcriptional regulator